jgi:uncharacterized protein
MLSETDKSAIVQTASQYGVHRVLLFGSSLRSDREGADIDIGIEGIPAKLFFKFYGDLIFKLSKPLDIIDLSQDNSFTRIVKKEGVVLYDES